MGKSGAFFTGHAQGVCRGCRRRIAYGDRCPDCARLVRMRAAKRRRKR